MVAPLVLGAILGGAKAISDSEREKRNRKTEAEVSRYSPWTGITPNKVQQADPLGAVGQGVMTGMMAGGMGAPEAAAAPAGVAGAANQVPMQGAMNAAPGDVNWSEYMKKNMTSPWSMMGGTPGYNGPTR